MSASLVGALRYSEPDEIESSLNSLIERRARQADPDEQEAAWREPERQYHAAQRKARRHMWVSYYRRLARSLRTSAESFEEKAAAPRVEMPRDQPQRYVQPDQDAG